MICVVIPGPTIQDAHKQIAQAMAYADLVELRLDLWSTHNPDCIAKLRNEFSIPMLFTLRSSSQGGSYQKSKSDRLNEIKQLATLNPEYLDLEWDLPDALILDSAVQDAKAMQNFELESLMMGADHSQMVKAAPIIRDYGSIDCVDLTSSTAEFRFIHQIAEIHPNIKIILSYHNFDTTPPSLDAIYHQMKQLPSHYLKIAVHAHNSIDAMELLCWAYKINKEDPRLIAISMGPHGQISRILAPLIGSPITYAALDDEGATAPGQITAQTLVERYNYRSIRHCSIYGLIGDPIEQSISDVTHNALMQKMHLNGVYIKIQVTPSELPRLLQLARTLSFRGLSVTMPLKELVIAYIDHIDSEAAAIGAVNTLVFDERGISGFNTDGIGALNAIGGSVKGKHMVIIGAGGAAKAIAYEAKKRGVHVTIVNRSIEKAKQLAATFDCSYGGLEEMSRLAESSYDILINSTPLPLPIDPQYILSKATVMDIKTKPQINPFIQHALDKGSHVIYGYQMFVEQAVGQFQLWYTDRIDQTTCRKSLAISVKTQLLA